MGYEHHLEPTEAESLDFARWKAAVRSTPRLRPTADDEKWDGSVEMRFGDEWIPVFRWGRRMVSFQLGDFATDVLTTALELAKKVDARAVGDEGEEYSSVDDLFGPQSIEDDEEDEDEE